MKEDLFGCIEATTMKGALAHTETEGDIIAIGKGKKDKNAIGLSFTHEGSTEFDWVARCFG